MSALDPKKGNKIPALIGGTLALIIYTVWKMYVIQTPTPDDDKLPDLLRDQAIRLLDSAN